MDPEPISFIFLTHQTTLIIGWLLLMLLLVFSALISGAEVAFFSLSTTNLNGETDKKEQLIEKLLYTPKKLLATILVANNFLNIAVVLLFAYLSEYWFAEGVSPYLKFFVEVVAVTGLILIFGEILPKVYATRNNLKFAKFMAYPLNVLSIVFTPLSSPMRAITLAIHKNLGKQKVNFSVDQLSQALELTSDEDTTDEEQKILQGIVSFGNTDTKQVMQPRIDIFALNENKTFQEILPELVSKGYSRVPVYQENIDTITGVLYVKDLLPYYNDTDFEWQKLLREPFFVPENKKLDDLMVEFQEKKVHLAIVVDEYGGTSGIISLEDVIEEIVGDISDEFDDEDIIYTKIDDHNYVFEAKTTLKDFYKVVKIENESVFEEVKGEAETLAGLILEISGKFPKRNSTVHFEGYRFKIESLDKRRIKRLKITLP